MTNEEKKELLSCLRFELTSSEQSHYTGGMGMNGSGSLYETTSHINLRLIADIEGEEIILSEEEISL